MESCDTQDVIDVQQYTRQLELEDVMRDLGYTEYMREHDKLLSGATGRARKPKESASDYSRKIMANTIDYLTEAIRKHQESDVGWGHANTDQLMEGHDPGRLAYLVMRTAFDYISTPVILTTLVTMIGRALENETMWLEFKKANPKYLQGMMRRISVSQSPSYRARNLRHAVNTLMPTWQPWSLRVCRQVGSVLWTMLSDTDLFVVREHSWAARRAAEVSGSPRLLEWIREYRKRRASMTCRTMPMLCQPRDWNAMRGGGYLTIESDLVHNASDDLRNIIPGCEYKPVYSAINHVQRCGWRINTRILDLITTLSEHNSPLLPACEDIPMPPYPGDDAPATEQKEWRQAAKMVYDNRKANAARRISIDGAIATAHKLRDMDAIYFPWYFDTRGRMYPASDHLHLQSSDPIRSMLQFAKSKPLVDDSGAYWLGVHAANTYGEDKIRLGERYKWAQENSEMLCAIADDPLNACEHWKDADKPFAFVAACMEWREFVRKGYAAENAIPIAQDGTCNGLQHYAAMARNERDARAVNVWPNRRPNSIYSHVAASLQQRLLYHTEWVQAGNTKIEPDKFAIMWSRFGIDKALCKRSVMIWPYSGTRHAMTQYLFEVYNERVAKEDVEPFEYPFAMCACLAGFIYDMLPQVIPSAGEIMHWLRKCASIVAKQNHQLMWVSPIGFVCCPEYWEPKYTTIATPVYGKMTFPDYNRTLVRRAKARNAFAPNFVHSLDASHLMMTINACADAGITSFAPIHDSYGTHASDTRQMRVLCRNAFVDMHTSCDQLVALRDQLAEQFPGSEYPDPPEQGDMDLELARGSRYMFN